MRIRPGTLLGILLALAVVCGGSLYGLAYYQRSHSAAAPQGDVRQLTLSQVETQTRLKFPKGTRLSFGEFYVLVDWAVAARVRIAPDALPGFLSANGLPKPTDGLRTVPGGVGRPPAPGPGGPAGTGTAASGTAPTGTAASGAAPTGTAAARGSASTGAAASGMATPGGGLVPSHRPPSPAASLPGGVSRLLGDDPGWHPEIAADVAGIPRTVNTGVARWVTLDLDDPGMVVVYIYAVAEVPQASLATPASRG